MTVFSFEIERCWLLTTAHARDDLGASELADDARTKHKGPYRNKSQTEKTGTKIGF
jgi:hypothetical protein